MTMDVPAGDAQDLQQQDVLLVRLADGLSPGAFQANLEKEAGTIAGSILAWTNADWFLIPQGYEQLLAERSPGIDVADTCLAAGAIEAIRVPFAEYRHRVDTRDILPERTPDFLRDKEISGVGLPSTVGETMRIGERTISLDWQLTVTGIARAWGLFGQMDGALPWTRIRVGHIDTGSTRHPVLGFHSDVSDYVRTDLGLNLFAELPSAPDTGYFNFDPPEEAGPFDNLTGVNGGHGTRTLSVLGGSYDTPTQDLEAPFFGAAPGVEIIPYRVTNSVLIDHVQRLIVQAIDHAVGNGVRIISMSLGGLVPYAKLSDAIDRAYESGVIVCAAAGNVISEVTYPGRYNRVVTVGGVTPDGSGFKPWNGASRGQFVDICGPADSVRRANVERKSGQFRYFISGKGDGTSYATALCAGIAALWLAKREDDLRKRYGDPNWQWPAAFKRLLKDTASRYDGWDTANWGEGVYQADALLAAKLPTIAALHKEAKAADPFDAQA